MIPSKTVKQKKEVIKIAAEDDDVWVNSDAPPAFPQSIIVLEKAMKQKGHLGSNTSNTVVSNPNCFFPSETVFLFLHGLQSVSILEEVIMNHQVNFKKVSINNLLKNIQSFASSNLGFFVKYCPYC